MAQTGFTPIQLYSSSTPTNAPSAGNLTNDAKGSELAINIADKNLFFKDSTNAVNTVPIRQSGAASDGWLSSTDWNTFNNKQPAGTYVTSVTGTAPVVSSGGTTPAISMAAATTSVNGYLTSTDWNTFNNKQAALVSGTNIKTVGGVSLLGSGDAGTIGVGYGGTGTSTAFTAGSVVFAGASGIYSQDNAGLFFDSANNALGIGSTSPNTFGKLAVVNASASNSTVLAQTWLTNRSYSTSNNGLALIASTSNGTLGTHDFGAITFNEAPVSNGSSGVVNMYAGGASSSFGNANRFLQAYYGTGSSVDYIAFWAGSAEKARIYASGGMSLGNTTDPGAGILSVSSGVRFPATQVASADANTLDDYEEGTWTPTQGAGLTVVGTFSSNGSYTKIGNLVTLRGELLGSTTIACAAGSALVAGGLPFTVSNVGGGTAANGGLNGGSVLYVLTSPIYTITAIGASGSIQFFASYYV